MKTIRRIFIFLSAALVPLSPAQAHDPAGALRGGIGAILVYAGVCVAMLVKRSRRTNRSRLTPLQKIVVTLSLLAGAVVALYIGIFLGQVF